MVVTEKQKNALASVEAAAMLKQAAESTFEKSVVKAREVGCSLREIEKVAGISNVTVLNLTRRMEAHG